MAYPFDCVLGEEVMMGFSGWWGGSRRWSGYGGGGVIGETWKRENGVFSLNVL